MPLRGGSVGTARSLYPDLEGRRENTRSICFCRYGEGRTELDMGKKKGKATSRRNGQTGNRNDPGARRRKPGRKKKAGIPQINPAQGLPIILEHFLPELLDRFRQLPDPRDPSRLYYPLDLLLMQGMMIPLTHAPSRKQFGRDCQSGSYRENLSALLDYEVSELASADAINYLFKQLQPEPLEAVLPDLAYNLIRSRALDRFRFEGHFLVAFDGTELMRWKNRSHCDNCLTATHRDGTTDHFHQVVDAKLVTEQGLTMSLGYEFIENEGENYVKQDCELKTFFRLAETVKNRFPRLSVCALGDALYACERVIDLFYRYGWSFFISFLPDRIPVLYAEAEARLAAHPENCRIVRDEEGKMTLTYRWANNLKYRENRLHSVFVDIVADNGKTMRLAYLTDFRADKQNVQELVNQGGRQRAKIEDCFNTQKNRGYGLEHCYGTIKNALKNFYTVIQIGHLIHQLMLNTDLLLKIPGQTRKTSFRSAMGAYGTIHHFVRSLAEALRHKIITDVTELRKLANRIQLRFVFPDSS